MGPRSPQTKLDGLVDVERIEPPLGSKRGIAWFKGHLRCTPTVVPDVAAREVLDAPTSSALVEGDGAERETSCSSWPTNGAKPARSSGRSVWSSAGCRWGEGPRRFVWVNRVPHVRGVGPSRAARSPSNHPFTDAQLPDAWISWLQIPRRAVLTPTDLVLNGLELRSVTVEGRRALPLRSTTYNGMIFDG